MELCTVTVAIWTTCPQFFAFVDFCGWVMSGVWIPYDFLKLSLIGIQYMNALMPNALSEVRSYYTLTFLKTI